MPKRKSLTKHEEMTVHFIRFVWEVWGYSPTNKLLSKFLKVKPAYATIICKRLESNGIITRQRKPFELRVVGE